MTILAVAAMTAIQSVKGPFPAAIPEEPLRDVRAYSVEIDENMNGTDGFYPLGILRDPLPWGFSIPAGANYTVVNLMPGKEDSFEGPGVSGAHVFGCQAALKGPGNQNLPKALGPDGQPLKRRAVNLFDPATLDRIFSVARKSVAYAVEKGDARIFKWEIDNEFIPELDFSPQAVEAFRAWLPGWYGGDVEKFRRVWGEGFSGFGDAVGIDPAVCRERPGPFMDWIRFQQESFANFLAEYYKTIYEADPRHRSVNGKDTQSSLEMLRIARARRANHELIGEAVAPYTRGVRGMDHYGHGDRNAYEMNFYALTATPDGWRPGARAGILYGENNNHNGPGWQWAQTLWRMPPNGLKGGNLFCCGWFGAWGDWASFGFENPDATKREKFWYVPRFFSTIHRAERFFTESAPARGVPKVAILMAQRDIPFGTDDNLSPWEFPVNSRLRVYSHLRDAGCFVDVIPYARIAREDMRDYGALFLVSAEHLSDADIAAIREYVRGGGVLFCDCRTGQFDEHNLAREADGGLSDVLGLAFDGIWESGDVVVDPGDVWFDTRYGRLLRGDGRVKFTATTAHPVNARSAFYYDNKAAVLMENHFGKGRAYWMNTQMGTLRSESSGGEEPACDFFRSVLDAAGVAASYEISTDRACDTRVECPLVDGKGNAVVMVAGRTWKPLEPMRLTMPLPEGLSFGSAFISLAEDNGLRPLAFVRDGARVSFDLPAVKSAAAIWLMSGDHPPLLGTRFSWDGRTAAPGDETPRVKPGETFGLTVQVANPSGQPLRGAKLRVRTLQGWKVTCVSPLGDVPPHSIGEAQYEITVAADGPEMRPDHLQPIVADLFVGGTRTAVTHTVVQADISKAGHELLLSDNWVSADCPWSIWNGATYRYLTQPDAEKGERIVDTLHTRRADGSDVFALQSGDRRERLRHASWKGLGRVEVEWDLKKAYDITRILAKRTVELRKREDRKDAVDPLAVSYSLSSTGADWTEPVRVAFVCDEDGFCDIELPEALRARFIRLAFECDSAKTTWLDETWIFGKLPPEADEAEKVPVVDVSGDKARQLVIAAGTEDLYQGHPTTVLTRTGKLICVWTTNHGGPCGPAAESLDGGRTWTRIDGRFPKEYAATCWNCPTLQKMVLPGGGERLLVFSARPPDGAVNHYDCPGICPLGIAYSDDDGATWRMAPRAWVSSIMPPTGFIQLKDGSVALFGQVRKYLGTKSDAPTSDQNVWMATSPNGLDWSAPRVIASVPEKNLCEPCALRSPDGDEIALLIRENRHTSRSMMCFSRDEGVTWSVPQETSLALTGDRHECVALPDGRVFVAFRDRAKAFGTYGHYVAWIGTYDDLRNGREGGARVKLLHSYAGDERFANASFTGDTGYSGVELLPDGDILCTTYVKYWPDARQHSVVSTRFHPEGQIK